MKRHIKWLIIPAVMILAVLIASAFLWPGLKIYLAPKTVLTAALTDTYSALETRAKNSPLLLLANTLDFENGNSLIMDLTTESKVLGKIQYDMDVQAKWYPRQLTAQGQVVTQGRTMDLSVYLDQDFAALSSAGMLQGRYYGLQYDSFSKDIRSNQLFALLIGEANLQDLEAKVTSLQRIMSDSYPLPELSKDDFKQLLMGIMALRPEVDKEIIHKNGIQESYYVISFETSGKVIQSGLRYLNGSLPVSLQPGEEVDIAFWLQGDSLARIELEAGEREVALYFGPDAASDDIHLRYDDNGKIRTLQIQTRQDAALFQETITVNGAQTTVFSYEWNHSTGDLELKRILEGDETTVFTNLAATEQGLRLETGDFESWMHLLLGTKDSADSPCTLTVTKGSDITTPEYKNFSAWSMEDLITLLSGFGSLFGFTF